MPLSCTGAAPQERGISAGQVKVMLEWRAPIAEPVGTGITKGPAGMM